MQKNLLYCFSPATGVSILKGRIQTLETQKSLFIILQKKNKLIIYLN